MMSNTKIIERLELIKAAYSKSIEQCIEDARYFSGIITSIDNDLFQNELNPNKTSKEDALKSFYCTIAHYRANQSIMQEITDLIQDAKEKD